MEIDEVGVYASASGSDLFLFLRSLSVKPSQRSRKLLVNPSKAAIGKNSQHIARLQLGSDGCNDCFRIFDLSGWQLRRRESLNDRGAFQPLVWGNALCFEDACHHDLIRHTQALYQLMLKDLPPQRIRPRLEDCPQLSSRIPRAQRLQRLADRS